ncbi:MAG TPA: P-loop NTPase, partial [Parachlamydiaceae bacterium]|nr:P-loop NTPase [Parachlamydiaceae bacterium]
SDHLHHIFGKGHAKKLSTNFHVELLGSIPLLPAIVKGGDEGYPAAFHQGDNQAGLYFEEIAKTLSLRLKEKS